MDATQLNAQRMQPCSEHKRGQASGHKVAALDRNQTLITVGLADRLNLLDRIQFGFGGVELYGKSLCACVKGQKNDERYIGIKTNHLRLLLRVSESLLCNASWCHLCLVVDLLTTMLLTMFFNPYLPSTALKTLRPSLK